MIILSIDPGVERLGIAVLTKKNMKIACIMSTTIQTVKSLSQSERIGAIFTQINKICQIFRPNQIVLERIFFAKNAKTAISVAQVQGIVYLLGYNNQIEVCEIAPNAIKAAVTGYGNADKQGVKKMIDLQVELPKKKRLDDEYDAIACGFAFLTNWRQSSE